MHMVDLNGAHLRQRARPRWASLRVAISVACCLILQAMLPVDALRPLPLHGACHLCSRDSCKSGWLDSIGRCQKLWCTNGRTPYLERRVVIPVISLVSFIRACSAPPAAPVPGRPTCLGLAVYHHDVTFFWLLFGTNFSEKYGMLHTSTSW